jgi:two-component system chemotaxis response regulator CheB
MGPKILIIDDSLSVIAMLTKMMEEIGASVIGSAKSADEGLELAQKLKPDIITLDIEMPGKTGLQILPQLQKISDAAIIMCSTLTNHAASATLQSLEKGAFDYIPKLEFNKTFTKEMLKDRIFTAYSSVLSKRKGDVIIKPTPTISSLPSIYSKLIVIGVSTGGPAALQKLFTALPVVSVPIVIVQHMPATFVNSLAERISTQTKHKAVVASHGEVLKPGQVYFAPGDKHVLLKKNAGQLIFCLSDEPNNILHKPSADVLFQTAAEVVGKDLLGVVLTGMGKDGAEGGKTIKQRGGTVIAETQSSCVVYGMPRAVIEARTAAYEFSLKDMSAAIYKLVTGKIITS